MALLDVMAQSYTQNFIIPLIVIIIVLRLSRRQRKRLHSKFFAYIVNKCSSNHNKLVGQRKEKLFQGLHEQASQSDRRISILEVGAGGGANFKYYPNNANITCLDPNPEFAKYLQENLTEYPGLNLLESVVGMAEDMSNIPSGSMDAVVCTMVLCSVHNPVSAVEEISRTLRAGGRYYFMEHVCADESTWLCTSQRLITPLWQMISNGCTFNRNTEAVIKNANFSKVNLERFRVTSWMVFLNPHISGVATK